MQSIHCIFMMIYAVYRLHVFGDLCSVQTASLQKRCCLYHLFMLSLQLEQYKCKDYGQECFKANNTLAAGICGQS